MLDAVYVSMLPPGSGTGTRVYDRMSAELATRAPTQRGRGRSRPHEYNELSSN